MDPQPPRPAAITVDAQRCVACKSCEIACALEHSRSKELTQAIHESPRPARHIRVQGVLSQNYPTACKHCTDAACVTACPTGAMHTTAGVVRSDSDRCIGCWMCVVLCPYGGVSVDHERHKAAKCDRCPERTARGEAPACVHACPTGCLQYGVAPGPEDPAAQAVLAAGPSGEAEQRPQPAQVRDLEQPTLKATKYNETEHSPPRRVGPAQGRR